MILAQIILAFEGKVVFPGMSASFVLVPYSLLPAESGEDGRRVRIGIERRLGDVMSPGSERGVDIQILTAGPGDRRQDRGQRAIAINGPIRFKGEVLTPFRELIGR